MTEIMPAEDFAQELATIVGDPCSDALLPLIEARDAAIRADQARRDMKIVHEMLDCHEPRLAEQAANAIERRAGIGKKNV